MSVECRGWARFSVREQAQYVADSEARVSGGVWLVVDHGDHFHVEEQPRLFDVDCLVCGWSDKWPTRDQAGCRATWHVFEEHPEVWAETFGDRPPIDPDPRLSPSGH